VEIYSTQAFVFKSISSPNEPLERSLSWILPLEHPIPNLLNDKSLTLERSSDWDIIPEACLELLEAHLWLTSRDVFESCFQIFWRQGVFWDWVDQILKGLERQGSHSWALENVVERLASAVEKVFYYFDDGAGTLFPPVAEDGRLLLVSDASRGIWLVLILWVQVLLQLDEKGWYRAWWAIPVEPKLLEKGF